MIEIYYDNDYVPQFFDKKYDSIYMEIKDDVAISLYDYNRDEMYKLFYDNEDNPLYDAFQSEDFSVDIDFESGYISIDYPYWVDSEYDNGFDDYLEEIGITRKDIDDFEDWIQHKIAGDITLYLFEDCVLRKEMGQPDIEETWEYSDYYGWYEKGTDPSENFDEYDPNLDDYYESNHRHFSNRLKESLKENEVYQVTKAFGVSLTGLPLSQDGSHMIGDYRSLDDIIEKARKDREIFKNSEWFYFTEENPHKQGITAATKDGKFAFVIYVDKALSPVRRKITKEEFNKAGIKSTEERDKK